MERILHRANTAAQIELGLKHGIDRLEVDVWYKNGDFRLAHDPSVGPLVFGRNGIVHSEKPWLLLRWGTPYLTLRDLLQQELPLYIDLKGSWSADQLTNLALMLAVHQRTNDIVASLKLDLVVRFSQIAPNQPVFYTVKDEDAYAAFFWTKDFQDRCNGLTFNAGVWQTRLDHRDLVRNWHYGNKPVFFWNLRPKLQTLHQERKLSDGIIIDDPNT